MEFIEARGHPEIRPRHPTTLMVTKDEAVGPRGDCIVAVAASKGAKELNYDLKRAIRSGAPLTLTIKAGGIVERVHAFGHPSLTLEHPTDLVVRKSGFICGRTLAVGADKAAADLSAALAARLRNPKTKIQISIEVHNRKPLVKLL